MREFLIVGSRQIKSVTRIASTLSIILTFAQKSTIILGNFARMFTAKPNT